MIKNGQALVETCLILPLIIFVFLIIVQIAFIITTSIVVKYASYMGARTAIVYNNNRDAINNAKKSVRIILASLSVSSSVLSDIKVERYNDKYTVKVSYPLKLIIKKFIPIKVVKGECSLVR